MSWTSPAASAAELRVNGFIDWMAGTFVTLNMSNNTVGRPTAVAKIDDNSACANFQRCLSLSSRIISTSNNFRPYDAYVYITKIMEIIKRQRPCINKHVLDMRKHQALNSLICLGSVLQIINCQILME